MRLSILAVVLFAFAPLVSAQPKTAEELADAVMKANGAGNWGRVKVIKWTFFNGRKHEWKLKEGTDTITTADGKTATIKVTGPIPTDPDQRKAFGAWTNDSYWLIAPLKIKDPGVMISTLPDENFQGKKYLVLHLKFKDVGMTPGDQYNMLINPDTMMLEYWDYMPSENRKTRYSWGGYKDFNGIKIATEHKPVDSDRKMEMKDVAVEFE
jgi:hypothetical protein